MLKRLLAREHLYGDILHLKFLLEILVLNGQPLNELFLLELFLNQVFQFTVAELIDRHASRRFR